MGVLRVVKGEDLVKELYDKVIKENKIVPPLPYRLYNSLANELKGKKILID